MKKMLYLVLILLSVSGVALGQNKPCKWRPTLRSTHKQKVTPHPLRDTAQKTVTSRQPQTRQFHDGKIEKIGHQRTRADKNQITARTLQRFNKPTRDGHAARVNKPAQLRAASYTTKKPRDYNTPYRLTNVLVNHARSSQVEHVKNRTVVVYNPRVFVQNSIPEGDCADK